MLEKINSPEDLKKIDKNKLPELAREIRNVILENVSKNGGHLASNLGMVEATIAIHRMFNAPDDKIVFDVGHQCYAHKLLTGRYADFSTLRCKDGISGFTKRDESSYDVLTAGHSGSSVSASLGIATASELEHRDNYTVCVIGDGSFTNGMVYEALNNCNNRKIKLIIILNDNEMSISSNVGSLASYLSRIRTSGRYFRFKHRLQDILEKIPFAGKRLVRDFRYLKNMCKRALLPQRNFFDALGVRYFGPVDGNNLLRLETVIQEAKSCEECCIIHMKTQKGKGYAPAEKNPEIYHSVGRFDIKCGVEALAKECFSEKFGEYMCEASEKNSKLCAITAAMCSGTGLEKYSTIYKDRFFDVGIAEEHEIAFAGGLAEEGMIPVCAVYSTFAQRVYDQVVHDAAIQNLHIVLALDRAGFVPEDGITHQGLFDVALFSTVPDCTIYSPETYTELYDCMDKAVAGKGVCVVRYPKGKQLDFDRSGFTLSSDGDFSVFGPEHADVTIITYGRAVKNAFCAAVLLASKNISVRIIKLVKVMPVDMDKLSELIGNTKLVYFLEEGIRRGGVSEYISSSFAGVLKCKFVVNAVDNTFATHANIDELYKIFGMDGESISNSIEKEISKF